MSNEIGSRVRYGEAFWREHHEAWQKSALNQRHRFVRADASPVRMEGRCPSPKILRREAPRRCYRCLRHGRQIATREIGDLTTDDRKNAAAWAGR